MVLIAVYACCLGLQIYPAVITFNQPMIYFPGVQDQYTNCFLGRSANMLERTTDAWRIAGWIGNIVFDGLVTSLTFFRAIRLRKSADRVTLADRMLQDGIYYFATVFTLNVATAVTFAKLHPGSQLLLQRMTQVIAVVMISHMFLNLKGSDCRGQEGTESRGALSSSRTMGPEPYERVIPLKTRLLGPRKMSTLVGNLGNDLIHTSILDYWTTEEKTTTFELQPQLRSRIGEDGDESPAHQPRNSEDSSVLPHSPTIKTTRPGLRPITLGY